MEIDTAEQLRQILIRPRDDLSFSIPIHRLAMGLSRVGPDLLDQTARMGDPPTRTVVRTGPAGALEVIQPWKSGSPAGCSWRWLNWWYGVSDTCWLDGYADN